MDEIPVCTAYELDGEKIDYFPFPADLDRAKPIVERLPGWGVDIGQVRRFEDLPKTAQDYVLYVEKALGTRISYVSVGPDRDDIILR